MGYVLIFISLFGTGEISAVKEGHYATMGRCFEQRDEMLKLIKPLAELQDFSVQAVCLAAPEGLESNTQN